MGTEIERKYLVKGNEWRTLAEGVAYRQGYLSTTKERTVRIRVAGEKAFLTIKGVSVGNTRAEYEYDIPLTDANEMLDRLCEKPIIEKSRFTIDVDGVTWEVDEFEGVNKGLIVAEIELSDEEQQFSLPEWIADEVSGDSRYFNANLTSQPYSTWDSD